MTINDRNLTLELFENDYYLPALFEWRNSPHYLQYCTHRSPVPSIEDFKNEITEDFRSDRHGQFIILWSGRPVGTIYSYQFNSIERYCSVSVYIEEGFRNTGIGIRSMALFSKLLFERYHLFKIYFDVFEYNKQAIRILEKLRLPLEGTFRKQHISGNDRYDVFRFAVYQEYIDHWNNFHN